MAYPDKPVLDYSFTAAEQALGDGSFPGAQLDAALAALKASIDAHIEFQKVVSRSDHQPTNRSIGTDALSAEALLGLNISSAAPWATETEYEVDQIVSESNILYICAEAHESGTFATDLSAGKWVEFLDLNEITLADGSVTTAKLDDEAVTAGKIGAGAVVEAKIGTGAVTADKIGANAVTTGKILNANVTKEKLATDSVGSDAIDGGEASAIRTLLGLAIGTNVQAFHANHAALAALTGAADKGFYFTAAGAMALYDLPSAARNLLDDTTVAAQRATLGVYAMVKLTETEYGALGAPDANTLYLVTADV